jgi:hypothetical protein
MARLTAGLSPLPPLVGFDLRTPGGVARIFYRSLMFLISLPTRALDHFGARLRASVICTAVHADQVRDAGGAHGGNQRSQIRTAQKMHVNRHHPARRRRPERV